MSAWANSMARAITWVLRAGAVIGRMNVVGQRTRSGARVGELAAGGSGCGHENTNTGRKTPATAMKAAAGRGRPRTGRRTVAATTVRPKATAAAGSAYRETGRGRSAT